MDIQMIDIWSLERKQEIEEVIERHLHNFPHTKSAFIVILNSRLNWFSKLKIMDNYLVTNILLETTKKYCTS